jgi:hypothetical protein
MLVSTLFAHFCSLVVVEQMSDEQRALVCATLMRECGKLKNDVYHIAAVRATCTFAGRTQNMSMAHQLVNQLMAELLADIVQTGDSDDDTDGVDRRQRDERQLHMRCETLPPLAKMCTDVTYDSKQHACEMIRWALQPH